MWDNYTIAACNSCPSLVKDIGIYFCHPLGYPYLINLIKHVTHTLSLNLIFCICTIMIWCFASTSIQNRQQRLCKICHSVDVEDKLHFHFFCRKQHDLKHTKYHKIKKQYADYESEKDVSKTPNTF